MHLSIDVDGTLRYSLNIHNAREIYSSASYTTLEYLPLIVYRSTTSYFNHFGVNILDYTEFDYSISLA